MLNKKKAPVMPDDETMLYCLVERCRFNDREGGCRAEGGAVMIEVGFDGVPCCQEFELDPCWIQTIPAIKN